MKRKHGKPTMVFFIFPLLALVWLIGWVLYTLEPKHAPVKQASYVYSYPSVTISTYQPVTREIVVS